MKSLRYAYAGRKMRKRDFRKLWITRISAACKMNGINYSRFMYGLKQAGYATDPTYAAKLIKYVEDYDLTRFDRMTVDEAMAMGGEVSEQPAMRESAAEVPESPLSIEEPALYTGAAGEEYRFSLSRTLYSRNGVPFVYAVEGETYPSLAKRYHLFEKEIYRFNDLEKGAELHAGDVVYLEPKKTHTDRKSVV